MEEVFHRPMGEVHHRQGGQNLLTYLQRKFKDDCRHFGDPFAVRRKHGLRVEEKKPPKFPVVTATYTSDPHGYGMNWPPEADVAELPQGFDQHPGVSEQLVRLRAVGAESRGNPTGRYEYPALRLLERQGWATSRQHTADLLHAHKNATELLAVDELIQVTLSGDAEALRSVILHRGSPELWATLKVRPPGLLVDEWVVLERARIVNEQSRRGNMTALHHAARAGLQSCAKVLLEFGAKDFLVDELDRTPLHHAAEMGQLALLPLVASKLALRAKDCNTKLAIQLAAQYHQLEAVQVLREQMREKKVPLGAKELNELCMLRSFR